MSDFKAAALERAVRLATLFVETDEPEPLAIATELVGDDMEVAAAFGFAAKMAAVAIHTVSALEDSPVDEMWGYLVDSMRETEL